MRSFGAKVIAIGSDFDDAKQHARRHVAQHSDCIFVEDGRDPAIAEGAGTIGVELLRAGTIDAVVVPLGDGALISRHRSVGERALCRSTKMRASAREGAAAMEVSWRAGRAHFRSTPPIPSPTDRGARARRRLGDANHLTGR